MSFFDRKKIGIILMLIIVGLLIFWLEQNIAENKKEKNDNTNSEEVVIPPPPPLEIIDEDSDNRPIAIMINNHPNTIPHHAGLQDAFLIYEMKVEGSFTRLMALYQDQTTERIGSVRSGRHYFLDYALEYDAIFTHFGGSPRTYTDIRSLSVNNLDFMARSAFFRDNSLNVAREHRAYTSFDLIEEELAKMNMRRTGEIDYLNYDVFPVRLYAGSKMAGQIKINYASSNRISYQFKDGYYYRSYNDKPHKDAVTDEQYHFKNILIKRVRDSRLDNQGRLHLHTVGSGDGYFITNGRVKSIKWEKDARNQKTTYKYEDGREVIFNDGNTIIQVVAPDTNVNFSNEEV